MVKKGSVDFPSGFEVSRKLGEGSASIVWAVRREGTNEELALKITARPDPARLLEREYAILRRLDHPGIVKVFESGEFNGRGFFLMELIEGESFTSFFKQKKESVGFIELFLQVLRESAGILSDLHKQGVVHIDVKPSNILIRKTGFPLLLDFGFAEDYILSPTAEPSGTTLDYAAPELFSGGHVTPAADIYSLGAMAYEVLKGNKPWIGKSPRELIAAKLRASPGLGKLEFEIPAGLEGLVLRMINPEPSLRPSADEVILELDWLSGGKSIEIKKASVFLPRLVFGGREEEMEYVRKLIFDEKKVIFLSGESGIGKTRFLRELRFKAMLDDRKVLLLEGRGAHLSLVDYLFVSLGVNRTGSGTSETQLSDKWSRYERISQEIENAGFEALYIDSPVDLNSDEKGLIGYLARGFDTRLGLLVTQVPEFLYPNATNFKLEPLNEERVRTLVSRTFRGLKGEVRLAKNLFLLAGGNPRRTNELLDILYNEGWLSWDRGWIYEPVSEESTIAAQLEEWLGDRVGRLDGPSRFILDSLAVVESALPTEVLSRIIGEDAELAMKGLAEHGLVRSFFYLEKPYLEFADDVTKPYLLGKLHGGRAKEISKTLAEAVQEYGVKYWGQDLDCWEKTCLADVGLLFFMSGSKTKAGTYLIKSAKDLRLNYHIERALEYLKKTIECSGEARWKKEAMQEMLHIAYITYNLSEAEKITSELMPLLHDDPEAKAEAISRLAAIYMRMGQNDRAEQYLDECERIVPDPSSTLLFSMMNVRGWIANNRSRYLEAQDIFQRALDMASSDKERRIAHQGLLRTVIFLGKNAEALVHATRAVELLEKGGDKNDLCSTLVNMTDVMRNLGMYSEMESCIEKALAIAEDVKNPNLLALTYEYRAFMYALNKKYRDALNYTRKAIVFSTKVKNELRSISLKISEAQYLHDTGEWSEAKKIYLETWQELARSKSDAVTRSKPYFLRAWGEFLRSRSEYSSALRILEKAKKIAAELNNETLSQHIDIVKCRVFIESGQLDRAERIIEECETALKKQKDIAGEEILNWLKTELYLSQGKTREAYLLCNELSSAREGKNSAISSEINITRLIGRTLLGVGKTTAGLSKLKEAIEASRVQENPLELGLSIFFYAEEKLKKHGFIEEAIEAFDEAETIFKRLGLSNLVRDIERLRREFPKPERTNHESNKYLEGFKELTSVVNCYLGKENYMNVILDTVLDFTKANRGMILSFEDGVLHPLAIKKLDTVSFYDAENISHTVIEKVKEGFEPVFTPDAEHDERFKNSESIRLNQIRSLMCVPLLTGGNLVGTIYLDSRQPGLFDSEKILYFESLGNLLAATLDKSLEFIRLKERLALVKRKHDLDNCGIVIGNSPQMREFSSRIEQVSRYNANVLLEGETGTGKGVIARMIHDKSNRREYEFSCINCGILPENIFESELFGCKKGAFTGAISDRIGLLESANGSTVFFDEITNTSLAVQAKLLEVIEDKVIRRLGETKKRSVDLRFIFATNRNIQEEIAKGSFREDLYFRLRTFAFHLPPLRERREDIPQFINFFMDKYTKEFNKDIVDIEPAAYDALITYNWPGNVRELKSTIERAVLLAPGKVLTTDLFERCFFERVLNNENGRETYRLKDEDLVNLVKKTLKETDGNMTETAKLLGISRRHLYRIIERFEMVKERSKSRKSKKP